MITDINHKSQISVLDRFKLPVHWKEYFEYENDDKLATLTKDAFLEEINKEKTKEKPFINSQLMISKLLTKFGEKHLFHRQFKEKHPSSNSAQTLGMQLYHILIQDNEIWIYCEIKEKGHLFPHATYFMMQ